VKPFRIAFRQEGEFVNCYLAKMGTMEGAELMGSMRTVILEAGFRDDYIEMMKKWVSLTVKDFLGVELARFDEEPAPEHERAGRA